MFLMTSRYGGSVATNKKLKKALCRKNIFPTLLSRTDFAQAIIAILKNSGRWLKRDFDVTEGQLLNSSNAQR